MTLTRKVSLETGFNEGSGMVGRPGDLGTLLKNHRLRKGESWVWDQGKDSVR